MILYKKGTGNPFLVIATLAAENSLYFRKNLLERIVKFADKIIDEKL